MNRSSVETLYDGNLFRSRLEARWAVFLDEAGIRWLYEPDWVSIEIAEVRYDWRPDFRLTADGRWVEVKGFLSPAEHERLLIMSSADGGYSSSARPGTDVIVLGHIPDDEWLWPVQLHSCRGDLWAVPWSLSASCPLETSRPRVPYRHITADLLLSGIASGQPRWAEEPLDAARSARF